MSVSAFTLGRRSAVLELHLGGDVDAAADGTGNGALLLVEAHHPVDGLPVDVRIDLEAVGHVDAFDDEDAVLDLDLTDGFGTETTVSRRDAARLERATQRARESAARGRHDVVERRGVGLVVVHRDPVVLGDRAVDAERDPSVLGG